MMTVINRFRQLTTAAVRCKCQTGRYFSTCEKYLPAAS